MTTWIAGLIMSQESGLSVALRFSTYFSVSEWLIRSLVHWQLTVPL